VASVKIHGPTGVLLVDGQKVFPIGISDPPPSNGRAPSGEHAYQELANGGITMIRSGTPDWAPGKIDQQIARERELQISAVTHGLKCWMRLGPVANLLGRSLVTSVSDRGIRTREPPLCHGECSLVPSHRPNTGSQRRQVFSAPTAGKNSLTLRCDLSGNTTAPSVIDRLRRGPAPPDQAREVAGDLGGIYVV